MLVAIGGIAWAFVSIGSQAPQSVTSLVGLISGIALALLGIAFAMTFASTVSLGRIVRIGHAVSPYASSAMGIAAAILAMGSPAWAVTFAVASGRPAVTNGPAMAISFLASASAVGLMLFAVGVSPPLLDLHSRRSHLGLLRRNAILMAFVAVSGLAGVLLAAYAVSTDVAFALVQTLVSVTALAAVLVQTRRLVAAQREMRDATTMALSAAESASQLRTTHAGRELAERLYLLEDALDAQPPRSRASAEIVALLGFARSMLGASPAPATLDRFASHLEPYARMSRAECISATVDFLRAIRARLS